MIPKKHKLRKNSDFKKVFKEGRYYQQDFIKLKILKNDLAITRFGFVVGLKASKKANQRNRIRRQLEEIGRLHLKKIKLGYDVVILTSPAITGENYQQIEKTLVILLKKAKVLG